VLRAKDARIHFATHFPGFPARMTIGSDGHVGIGTTTPTRELQVVSTRAGGGVEVYGDASSGTHDSPGFHLAGKDVGGADREGVLGLSLSSGHYSASAGPGDLVLRSRDGGIHFSTQSSGGYPAKMTLGADGVFFLTPKNLGNTHPTLSGSQLAIGWNHSGGRGETDFYQHGGGGWRSGYDFWTQRDGVGKRLQARIEDTGHLRIRGEYKSLSDVREKTAIQPLSGALEKVLRLRGISFEWADKTSRDEGRRLGLVAQEVREVVPEVVSGGTDEMGGEEPLDLQYDGLIPLLIEAIREQQQAIDRLTRRVGELEAE
jgi:hypothetical protein